MKKEISNKSFTLFVLIVSFISSIFKFLLNDIVFGVLFFLVTIIAIIELIYNDKKHSLK